MFAICKRTQVIERIEQLLKIAHAFSPKSAQELEDFRIKYLGRNGELNHLFDEFKAFPPDQKKVVGQKLNELKNLLNEKVKTFSNSFAAKPKNFFTEDYTKPGEQAPLGSLHPVSIVREKIIRIFSNIGFTVAEGPEIEDDWHNFSALNLPEDHPARDMQDTFYISKKDPNRSYPDDILLRTHTSSVQIRYMETHQPPIRILSPGRVYRNEAISARSHCMFHQIEGLYIDHKVTFADLKQVLRYFTTQLFGKSEIRLRPSYFPFTEPSAEVDVYWGLETETDYRITKGTGWLEIMGCGMVDPQVLLNVGIDPETYSGYAFGMGIERIVMLLYQIGDIRDLFTNDLRLLEQFRSIQVW